MLKIEEEADQVQTQIEETLSQFSDVFVTKLGSDYQVHYKNKLCMTITPQEDGDTFIIIFYNGVKKAINTLQKTTDEILQFMIGFIGIDTSKERLLKKYVK